MRAKSRILWSKLNSASKQTNKADVVSDTKQSLLSVMVCVLYLHTNQLRRLRDKSLLLFPPGQILEKKKWNVHQSTFHEIPPPPGSGTSRNDDSLAKKKQASNEIFD
ncbi:hypothetical protein CEXT_419501 [Caerostris extrusa]|uniref:Uncharacterized protein n=1 Tax=Caerostris extrusa TaxID=172846 RepID=A0AAV4N8P9_CAEEX|nr:hypothetical protein CEXT_419501 [Caerostris extrusa]